MLRAAIVGLGWWGKNLVTSVQGKTERYRFTACCTRSPGQGGRFCTEHGIALVDDYAAVLADPNIDAVVLATPPSAHDEQVQQSRGGGQACVRREAVHADGGHGAAGDRGRAKGRRRAGGRLQPALSSFDERAAQPHPRRPARRYHRVSCSSTPRRAAPTCGPTNGAPIEEETPAGAMTGIGIHIVDGMIDLFGPIAEVHCIATRRVAPLVDDTTAVLVKFRSGLSGVFFCSFVTVPNYRLAVYGANGVAEVLKPTQDEFRFAPLTDPKAGHLAQAKPEVIVTPGFDTLQAELEAFAAAVKDRRPYPISADQVLHGVEVFEAIAKSAKRGGPVTIG